MTPVKERPRRVLVVEDDPFNREVAVRMLVKLGYEAEAVTNGTEAIRAAAKAGYDAILMDCHMPEMDGFEATAAIRRQEPAGLRTPIIAMTAASDEWDRCRAAGMDVYMIKPASAEELAGVLAQWAAG